MNAPMPAYIREYPTQLTLKFPQWSVFIILVPSA